jgi:hypothetical protein
VSDLTYSIDLLTTLGGNMLGVSSDFTDGEGSADYDSSDLGHHRVAEAMDNFRENWNDNREHLAEKLSTLGDLALKAAEGFSEADADLAKKIRESVEAPR